jgi:hypothetical protein
MKNIQIVSRLVARENNYDLDLVEEVNQFFWKEVRRSLTSMEHTSVSIKHLGTITVSKRKVDYIIKKLIKKIRDTKKSTRLKPSTIELVLEVNYDKLRRALKQRNVLAKQYYENYAKRTSRIHQVASDDNEECGQDNRSDNHTSEGGDGNALTGRTGRDSEETTDLLDVPIH